MSDLPPPPPTQEQNPRANRTLVVVIIVLALCVVGLGGFLIGNRPSPNVSPSSSPVATSSTLPPVLESQESVDQELVAWQIDFEEDLLQMRSSLQSFRAISSGWVESTSLFDSARDLIDNAFEQAPKAPDGMNWDSWLGIQDAVTEFEKVYSPGFRMFGERLFFAANDRYPDMADDMSLMDWWRQGAQSEDYFPALDPDQVARFAIGAVESLLEAM